MHPFTSPIICCCWKGDLWNCYTKSHTAHHLLGLRASDTSGWAEVTCLLTIGGTVGWYCAGDSRWILCFVWAESAGWHILKVKVPPLNFVVSCPTVLCQMHFPCWTAHSFIICSWVKLFCQDTKVWNSLSVELNCLELDRMLGEWNNRLLSLWSFWCFHKQCFPDYGSSWEMWGIDPWNEKQRADFPLGLSDKHEDQRGCLCWQTSIYYPAD